MKYGYLLAASLFFAACGSNNNKPAHDSLPGETIPATITAVQTIRPNIDLTPWDGNLYDAIYWQDSRGENIVLVSGEPQYFWKDVKPALKNKLGKDQDPETFSEATELFARHYVLKKGEAKWTLYYEYTDVLMGCCDVWMEYQPRTLAVMDKNADGKGEVVFMYHTTEADGKIENNWDDYMTLLKDSTSYRSHPLNPGLHERATVMFENANYPWADTLFSVYIARWDSLLAHPDTTVSSATGDIHIDHIH